MYRLYSPALCISAPFAEHTFRHSNHFTILFTFGEQSPRLTLTRRSCVKFLSFKPAGLCLLQFYSTEDSTATSNIFTRLIIMTLRFTKTTLQRPSQSAKNNLPCRFSHTWFWRLLLEMRSMFCARKNLLVILLANGEHSAWDETDRKQPENSSAKRREWMRPLCVLQLSYFAFAKPHSMTNR